MVAESSWDVGPWIRSALSSMRCLFVQGSARVGHSFLSFWYHFFRLAIPNTTVTSRGYLRLVPGFTFLISHPPSMRSRWSLALLEDSSLWRVSWYWTFPIPWLLDVSGCLRWGDMLFSAGTPHLNHPKKSQCVLTLHMFPQRNVAFYMRAAASFLRGTEDKKPVKVPRGWHARWLSDEFRWYLLHISWWWSWPWPSPSPSSHMHRVFMILDIHMMSIDM